jgi:hypothetical protein
MISGTDYGAAFQTGQSSGLLNAVIQVECVSEANAELVTACTKKWLAGEGQAEEVSTIVNQIIIIR